MHSTATVSPRREFVFNWDCQPVCIYLPAEYLFVSALCGVASEIGWLPQTYVLCMDAWDRHGFAEA
jgi:hypothetical protein